MATPAHDPNTLTAPAPTRGQVIQGLADLAQVPLSTRSGVMLMATGRAEKAQVLAAISRSDRDLAMRIITASLNSLLMDLAIGPVLKANDMQALLNSRGEAVFDLLEEGRESSTHTLRAWIDEAKALAREVDQRGAARTNVANFPGRRAPTLAPPSSAAAGAYPEEGAPAPTPPIPARPSAATSAPQERAVPQRSYAGPHRSAPARESARGRAPEAQRQVPRVPRDQDAAGTSEDDSEAGERLTTVRDERGAYMQVKVHGAANALTVVAVELARASSDRPIEHTVMFELAGKLPNEGRKFAWTRKLVLKLTHHELVMVNALVRGHVESLMFGNHGPAQDKWFAMHHQGKHIYLVAGATKSGEDNKAVVHSLPIGPDSLFKFGALLYQQLMRANPGIDAIAADRLLATTAKMCLADPNWVKKNEPRRK